MACRNSELYAMHQRQLQLRKEQQSRNLTASGLTSSTGILLGGPSAASINSPAAANNPNGAAVDGVAGVVGGVGGDASFNSLGSQRPALLDYQDESSSMHDSKTGISTAEDEGGGVAGTPGSGALGETKDLLTSKGLQPSINDLDNLFDDNMIGGLDDNSNDESVSSRFKFRKD